MNSSPGLLAGDRIKMNLDLGANTGLYLTEQAATKVHAMPQPETIASIDFHITIGEAATLELIPEPIIFYQDAALTQKTKIAMHHLKSAINCVRQQCERAALPYIAKYIAK